MKRKQFTFYHSFYEAIEKIPTKKEKADAYRMLCDYALNGNLPDLTGKSPYVSTVFAFAIPVLESAHVRAAAALKRTAVNSSQSSS